MRDLGIEGACARRKRPRTTLPVGGELPTDLLERDFAAPAPNRRWVADLTYVKTHSGWAHVAFGWRAIFVVLAVFCAALAVTVQVSLPPDTRTSRDRYTRVLVSMGRLATTDRLFASRAVITFFLFASFGTLWSGLALPLGAEPWAFGTTEIGLFGLAGLAGALGATRAGKWADTGYAQLITGWSLALLAASWFLIAQTEPTLWALIAGVILLDFAVQAVHVSSQHLLTTAHPHHASSVIGTYMAFYSLGSAVGAVTTTWAYTSWGWWASCLIGAAYALAGLCIWGFSRRGSISRPAVAASRS
jgi:predicted MFS family arabinose efflux permease